jgi:hypothetical protein
MPAAMVVGNIELQLCNASGPFFAVPLIAIRDVDVVKFEGLTLEMHTSARSMQVVQRHNFGVEITYEGLSSIKRLRILTLYADAARMWTEAIGKAIDDLGFTSHDEYLPKRRL